MPARPRFRRLLAVPAVAAFAVPFAVPHAVHDRGAPIDRAPVARQTAVAPPASPPAGTTGLTVGAPLDAPPVASGFVGLSIEVPALTEYAGHDPNAIDPVFAQLVRNLAPGQRPVVRIGGDSTDRSWVAAPGMVRPGGVRFTITPDWLAVAGALARELSARMIVGVDLEADSRRLAAVEARAMLTAIGPDALQAFELGNEPELYGSFPWYQRNGHGVTGRRPGWGIPTYIRDIARIAGALPSSISVAAPGTGSTAWIAGLGQILSGQRRITIATVHRYPLNRCFTPVGSSRYPTIPNLLAPASSVGLAGSVAGFVRTAHAHRVATRVDEFNSVACSGKRGVSDTFASALWALDAAFAMARVGVDGINVHTFPGGIYQLFRLRDEGGRWLAGVRPEYYGLLMFTRAAPPGARLLSVTAPGDPNLRVWATRAPGGVIHVVVIDDSLHRPHTVALSIPGAARGAAAQVQRLRAPRVTSQQNVTLGERSFGTQTATGVLAAPVGTVAVAPTGGRYVVRVPAASAAMVTVAAGSSPG